MSGFGSSTQSSGGSGSSTTGTIKDKASDYTQQAANKAREGNLIY